MAPYRQPDPKLDEEYRLLLARAGTGPADGEFKAAANSLALRIRSRCIDLAVWQADSSPEYRWREEQCRVLLRLAAEAADPLLESEFGKK